MRPPTPRSQGLAGAIGASRHEQIADEALSLDQAAAIARAWSLVHGFTMLLLDDRLSDILRRMPEGTNAETLLDAMLNRRSAAAPACPEAQLLPLSCVEFDGNKNRAPHGSVRTRASARARHPDIFLRQRKPQRKRGRAAPAGLIPISWTTCAWHPKVKIEEKSREEARPAARRAARKKTAKKSSRKTSGSEARKRPAAAG